MFNAHDHHNSDSNIIFCNSLFHVLRDNCFAPNPHNHHLCLILQIGKLVKYIHCTINYTNNKVLHFYYNFQSHGTQRTPSLITE